MALNLNLHLMRVLILSCCFIIFNHVTAISQDANTKKLPYYQIPEAPESYTAGTVISRMIDGLGFRYYWATDGLTEKELNYEPGNNGRTASQTIDHLLGLSNVIVNSAKKIPNDRTIPDDEVLTFDEKRERTLNNFKIASDIFRNVNDLSQFSIVFKNANGSSEFPFWNQINGPIEDAVWHAGQIVVLRRSAGLPISSGVNVFLGKKMN